MKPVNPAFEAGKVWGEFRKKKMGHAPVLFPIWHQAVLMSRAAWLFHRLQSEYTIRNTRASASKVIGRILDIPWITQTNNTCCFLLSDRQEAQLIQTRSDPSSVLKKETLGPGFSEESEFYLQAEAFKCQLFHWFWSFLFCFAERCAVQFEKSLPVCAWGRCELGLTL